jgi:hypothetical protein
VTAIAEPTRTRPVDKIAGWLFTTPLWVLVAAAFAVSVVLHGLGAAPHIAWIETVSRDPFTDQLGNGSWVYSSPLGPLIGWATGVQNITGLTWLGFLWNIAAIMLTVYAVAVWRTETAGRMTAVAFFCSPVSNLSTTWLGQTDTFTVLAATLVTIGPVWAAGAGGVLLGFNHFEQGVFIVAAAAIIRLAVWRRRDRRPVVAMIGGLAVGRVLLWVYHDLSNIDAGSARKDFVEAQGVSGFVEVWRGDLPTLIFSVYNVAWIAVIAMIRDVNPRTRWTLIALQAALTVPVLLTFDMTRVYALVTWPILIATCVWAANHTDEAKMRQWTVYLAGLALVVPHIMFWYEGVYVSSWDRFL